MKPIEDIHDIAREDLGKHFTFEPVALTYPLPERPVRTLGLVKIDGEVFTSEKLSRAVFLQVYFPVFLSVRSMFLRPRPAYDLPVFACEIVLMGGKRLFITDIHRTGAGTGHDDSGMFEKMLAVRDKYPELQKYAAPQKGGIENVFSHAACQVKIPKELDEQAISLFREYLALFAEIVKGAEPLAGERLVQAKKEYDEYLKTIIDHDPGVRGYKMLFGAKGGVERSMNMHFAQ